MFQQTTKLGFSGLTCALVANCLLNGTVKCLSVLFLLGQSNTKHAYLHAALMLRQSLSLSLQVECGRNQVRLGPRQTMSASTQISAGEQESLGD